MHIITQKRIWEAKEKWLHSATALDAWYRLLSKTSPKDFAAMKQLFPSVDKVGDKHVFDIGGNKLRLIATVDYTFKKVFIRAVLDHKEYDRNQWK
ncbi:MULTISPECIES: type II toxin-antitoxin system HigB family toxin [unclassified Pseudomonas]|uniref:type II toxin-antitoxin system HigB family toxin n=1 Tax=unclassified Pseudomonas TaxID=196821 RepID=UPI002446836B|nr:MULTISPECIES: type II toxin-antitoxin system HigB family toxin [unclassified Pseudomonas]MDH0894678.1 type II toxin-antitoxin system HigB family toxin [Pseudomonas sp. GD03875]MDH1067272.1 type II toxin-antitoxin system HigB family toxin [Pseudomonas sp. GD03985]